MTSLVCVGHNTARVILETSREQNCNLILMGWKGYTSTGQRILGEITDNVITHARRDIMLVKPVGTKPLRKILFPTAGGPHALQAEQYVSSIARYYEASVTVCGVALESTPNREMEEINTRMDESATRLSAEDTITVDSKVIHHDSVSEAIVKEAKKYDAVVIGAAGYGLYKQILFGSIPETIARYTTRTVILVKHHQPARALVSRVMKE